MNKNARLPALNRTAHPDRRLVLAAATGTTIAALMPSVARARDVGNAMEEALAKVFEAEKPVALAGRFWKDGQTVWQGAKGLRRAGGDAAVTTEDVWHLGSNSKAMTAALWARLVEQGRAQWDRPLTQVVAAAFPDMTVHEAWADRTVEDFMRHRAGLYDARHINGLWLMTARADRKPLIEQRRAMVGRILGAAPDGARGTFQYGNANYILVGALMEGLTGQSWEDLMRAEVFAPLGIATGGFGPPLGDQPWGHDGARPIDPAGGGGDNPAALGPAGTAHMALEDYGRFLNAMMTPGWLSQDSLDKLLTPLEGEEYALGWIAIGRRGWASGPVLTHSGSNTMWFATAVLAPAVRQAFVTVANDAAQGQRACSILIPQMIAASSAS